MKMQKFEIRVWPPTVHKGDDVREMWAVITGPNRERAHVHSFVEVGPAIRKLLVAETEKTKEEVVA